MYTTGSNLPPAIGHDSYNSICQNLGRVGEEVAAMDWALLPHFPIPGKYGTGLQTSHAGAYFPSHSTLTEK